SSAVLAQFGQLGFVLIIGLYGGTLPAFLVEAAPPQVRCTAVSLGYNICFGVIGGGKPLVAGGVGWRTGGRGETAFFDHGVGSRYILHHFAISRNVPRSVR